MYFDFDDVYAEAKINVEHTHILDLWIHSSNKILFRWCVNIMNMTTYLNLKTEDEDRA